MPEQKNEQSRGEWMRRMSEEMMWCFKQPAIVDEHPGEVVVVHARRVLGWGPGSVEALEDARRRTGERGEVLPERHELLFIPVPDLRGCDLPSLANGTC